MTNLVPIGQAQAPATMQARRASGTSINKAFSEGIRDAFPILSIKGKVWRARISGVETPFIDQTTQQVIPALDVVLVNASPSIAKTFYKKGFTDGDVDAPDCWSLDGIRPDPSVADKVSPTCAACPMNAFGSRITENGKQAKACSDSRRMAVVMPHHLGQEDPMVLMLRVPQSSLKNLKAYSQLLDRHGFDANGCVTRMSFDYQEAYPKILFNFVSPLNEQEYSRVIALAEHPNTTAMLNAPDFENAASTQPKQDDGSQHTGVGGMERQAGPVLAGMPDQTAQGTQPAQPAQTAQPTVGLITLPDGKLFNPATGQYVEPEPEPEPEPQLDMTGLIELPDGKLFNPATGQYVERPAEAKKAPEPDPNTIQLPDGKFFNRVSGKFVTGPEIGAGVVGEDKPAEQKTTRARRTRKKAEDKPAEQEAKSSPDTPAEQEAQAETKPEPKPEPETKAANANGPDPDAVKPAVGAAPADLEKMLMGLLPPQG